MSNQQADQRDDETHLRPSGRCWLYGDLGTPLAETRGVGPGQQSSPRPAVVSSASSRLTVRATIGITLKQTLSQNRQTPLYVRDTVLVRNSTQFGSRVSCWRGHSTSAADSKPAQTDVTGRNTSNSRTRPQRPDRCGCRRHSSRRGGIRPTEFVRISDLPTATFRSLTTHTGQPTWRWTRASSGA